MVLVQEVVLFQEVVLVQEVVSVQEVVLVQRTPGLVRFAQEEGKVARTFEVG